MNIAPTGWKYYVSDEFENIEEILSTNEIVWDASDAAQTVSRKLWDLGGYKDGIDLSEEIVILDPKGNVTHWKTYYETSVIANARMLQ